MKTIRKKRLKKRIEELKARGFSEPEYIPILLKKWANMPIEEYLKDDSFDPPIIYGDYMLEYLADYAHGHENMTYLETAACIYLMAEAVGGIERMIDLRRSSQVENFLHILARPLIKEYRRRA